MNSKIQRLHGSSQSPKRDIQSRGYMVKELPQRATPYKWNRLLPSQQNSTTTTHHTTPHEMQTLKASGHMDQVNLRRETYNPAVTWLKNHTINGIGTRSHTIQRLQFSWRHYVRTDATTWIYCETVRSQRPVDPNGDWDKLLRSFKSNYTPVVKESRLQPS